MNSITKNRQSVDILGKIIEKAIPNKKISASENSITELGDGCFNVAYLITLNDKTEVILKISPDNSVKTLTYEKNIMFAEVDSIRFIKENTDIPVPTILFYDNTKEILNAEYFIMEKIEGSPYEAVKNNMSDEDKYKIEYRLGEYNRKINNFIGKMFGYYGNIEMQFDTWGEFILNAVHKLLKNGIDAGADIGVDYEMVENLFIKNKALFDEIKTPHLIHWDLWDGNIFVKDNNITGLIDFERCLWGDPLMELYFSESENSSKGFLDGYNHHYFSENDKKRRLLYTFYQFLIINIECSYRLYDNDWMYNWSKDSIKTFFEKCSSI